MTNGRTNMAGTHIPSINTDSQLAIAMLCGIRQRSRTIGLVRAFRSARLRIFIADVHYFNCTLQKRVKNVLNLWLTLDAILFFKCRYARDNIYRCIIHTDLRP